MTRSRKILPLLVEGCHSVEAIAERTGFDVEAVHTTVQALRRSGFAESVVEPTKYKATALGVAALSKAPKSPPELITRKTRERKAREARRAAEATSIVGNAMDRQPAIQQVWR